MIKRLILRDFMAHGHTELNLGPGVTVLTGRNNTGKSAVVEALRCLVTNPPPKFHIKHNAKKAEVEVELNDGRRVVWVRKPKTVFYETYEPGAEEPETFAKLQQKVPEEVAGLLKMVPVLVEGTQERGKFVDIHIGDQKEPVFLLNESGGFIAKFFAASTEAAHLLSMQKLLRTKMQTQKKEAERISNAVEDKLLLLQRFEPLPELTVEADEIENLLERIETLEHTIPALDESARTLRKLLTAIAFNGRAHTVLQRAEVPPDLVDTAPLMQLQSDIRTTKTRMAEAREISNRLEPLAPAPQIQPVKELDEAAQRLRSLSRDLNRMQHRQAALQQLKSTRDAYPAEPLREFIEQYRRTLAKARATEAKSAALAALEPAEELRDMRSLAEHIHGMRGAEAKLEQEVTRAAQYEEQLETLHSKLEEHINTLGRCPTCGNELTVSGFLQGDSCRARI